MFLQPCFLRDASKDLFVKMTLLGYKPSYQSYELNFGGSNLVCEFGTWHFTDSDNHPDYIDCGWNVQLFLCISSLRDDSDIMQWFTDGLHWEIFTENRKMDNSDIFKWQEYFGKEYTPHKATVEELIKKFR